MVVCRWNYRLQLLFLYFYYIRHSVCQEVEVQQQEQQRRQQQQQQQQGPINPHLLFYGRLRNDIGYPVKGAQVQFWHADYNGKYFHPGDDLDGYELLHDTFSYFGTAKTDASGNFAFKTYRPGIYPSRPITHIHFKVFYRGQELLTSQFYFDDESASLVYDNMLVFKLQESVQADGNSFFYATKKVVVNMGMGGSEKLTPVQMEGPFYPVIDFFDIGNDMTTGLLNRLYGGTESPSDIIQTDEPILESVLSLSQVPSFSLSQVPSFAPTTIKDGNSTTTDADDSKSTDYDDDFVDFEDDNESEDGEAVLVSSLDEKEEDESNGNMTATTTIIGDDDGDDGGNGNGDNDNEAISSSEEELPPLDDSPSDDIDEIPSSPFPTSSPMTSEESKLDNNTNATTTIKPKLTEAPTSNPTIEPTENPKKTKPDNNAKKTESPTSNPTNSPTEKPRKSTPDNNDSVIKEKKEQDKTEDEIGLLPLEDNVSSPINLTIVSATIDNTAEPIPGSGSRFLRRINDKNNR